MQAGNPHRTSGFTLIELLAVIAIIAILVGLGWMGMRSAKNAAHSAKCITNLRQIYTLAQIWSNDHKGIALSSGSEKLNDDDKNYFFWRRQLLNQLDSKWDKRGLDSYKIMDRMKGADYDQLMWCPSYVAEYGKSQNPSGRGSYSLNYHFRLLSVQTFKANSVAPAKEPYIICGSPFAPAWKVEWGSHHSFSTLVENATYNGYGGAAYFHGGKTNVIFFDGRVKALTPGEAARYESDVKNRDNF